MEWKFREVLQDMAEGGFKTLKIYTYWRSQLFFAVNTLWVMVFSISGGKSCIYLPHKYSEYPCGHQITSQGPQPVLPVLSRMIMRSEEKKMLVLV